ncbi:MAG: EAL domain-containing protein [Pseudomonadota bacterium]
MSGNDHSSSVSSTPVSSAHKTACPTPPALGNTVNDLVHASSPDAADCAASEAGYVWNFDQNTLDWEPHAAEMIGVATADMIATGDRFRSLIAPEYVHRHAAATLLSPLDDQGQGVPYRLTYRLQTSGLRSTSSIWVEDFGRWWSDETGRPARAQGVLRLLGTDRPSSVNRTRSSDFDTTTGQLSRARLSDALVATMERSTAAGVSCGFVLIAVDGLERYGDTHGAEARDKLVLRIAQAIRLHLRGGDVLGRYSTTKFAAVLNVCDGNSLNVAAGRLATAVRNCMADAGARDFTQPIAIGGLIIPDSATTVSEAFAVALRAVAQAREDSRSPVVLFTADHPGRATMRQLDRGTDLSNALQGDRFELFVQPIVAAGSRKVVFHEALVRLRTADGRLIAASDFVADAEAVGLVSSLDRRGLELAITAMSRHPSLSLSVNVSALTCGDTAWLETLRTAVEAVPDLGQRLLIEITETAAFHDVNVAAVFVDRVKALGCRVAIDDFGVGYTTFACLKALNVDVVKLDGSFIRNLVDDPADQVFVRAMVDLSKVLAFDTVAEWVGDEATAQFAEKLGVTHLQGYHFGMPEGLETLRDG